ncbi:MAG: glutamate synthase subunit beta [Candidatus Omnitrophota bacterium]
MGDPKGFLKIKKKTSRYRPVCERVKDYREVVLPRSKKESEEQSSRCMDCGTPFCHWGCPVGNYIPEWNDLAYNGQWERAFELLDATNNLPEITGRVCPAPCEYSCVLGINDDPVTIKENEFAIIEYGFKKGFIRPRPPKKRTGKKVAVIGSGPAGIACAAQLNRAGHKVTVFEQDEEIGGIMRYGIPDFKLEKWIIERRVELLKKEGIVFKTGVYVGKDYSVSKLKKEFDAMALTGGSREPRDLKIEGRGLKGIHFAMDYLCQSNRKLEWKKFGESEIIDANAKKVVIIGGGDTGADCVGTAHRQGASCVVQIELLERPAECRTDEYPWPKYPMLLKSTTSHEEGGQRYWSVATKRFAGEGGLVKKLSCIKLEFKKEPGNACPVMKEVPGSDFEIEVDLVILAIGFVHPEHKGLLEKLGLEFDARGNVKTDETFMTSKKGVFAAGDIHRGQSLIVWAISEGRTAAHHIDKYLMGSTNLPNL